MTTPTSRQRQGYKPFCGWCGYTEIVIDDFCSNCGANVKDESKRKKPTADAYTTEGGERDERLRTTD